MMLAFFFTLKARILSFKSMLSKQNNALDGFLDPRAPQGPVLNVRCY